MARHDPHSYTDDAQPRADTLTWRAHVDFPTRALSCEATLRFAETAQAGPLDLDTRALVVESVVDEHGTELEFELGRTEPILGQRLRVAVPRAASAISLRYRTSPEATALQWLDPSQTSGGRQPFLYTQCQPIHARSVVPLQDTPTTRLRFDASIDAPPELTVLMAAEALADGSFRMQQPIAPYLFAFAIGDLVSRDLGPRTRVWAEPSMVEDAAWEFAETEQMLSTGEQLFGPYDWGRYDVLVLPPAFPYGGMENPRLTFLTPSVVVGDRSSVAVIAHELAHSWTGNLISNANAEHFWLNEGGATYAERRIVEALWGSDTAQLDWALGRQQLDEAMQRLESEGRPQLTCLRTHLDGIDPDDAYTQVPYEKGALLFRALEQAAGRAAFDTFLRAYIDRFRFRAITTEEFVAFLQAQSPRPGLDPAPWLYEPGLPVNAPRAASSRLDAIRALHGRLPSDDLANAWTATEWQLYIDSVPAPAAIGTLEELDTRYDLTATRNYDVVERWLVLGIRSGYGPAVARAQEVLGSIGRMKYLRPLYSALADRQETRALAQELFERYAPRYHPIARQVVAGILLRRQ
ncbi:MAG: M1 family metallopeptidase [Chloroflexi bacterium]|nr:M1 family metallopeptidase [Chloroflexota bacterium]